MNQIGNVSVLKKSLYNYCQTNGRVELLKEWNAEKNLPLTPRYVSYGSHRKVWWQCGQSHEWQAVVKSRVSGTGCPVCTNRTLLPGVNDLATVYPNIAAQWDPILNGTLTPEMVTAGSHKKIWWQCPDGHV